MKRWIAGIAAGLVFVIAVILIARHLVVKYYLLDGGNMENPNQPAVASNQDYGKVENFELVELSWYQDTMSHDDCFFFRISESGHVHRICCSYTDPVTYERITVGNENAVDECPVIPANRWEDIADLVQASGLSDYQAPDSDDIDANNSKIEAIWRKDDSLIVDEYNGSPASSLRDLLQTTSAEAISRPQAE